MTDCPGARLATAVFRQSSSGAYWDGTWMSVVPVIDREVLAGQRVLRVAAVGGRAEPGVLPGTRSRSAGPAGRSGR